MVRNTAFDVVRDAAMRLGTMKGQFDPGEPIVKHLGLLALPKFWASIMRISPHPLPSLRLPKRTVADYVFFFVLFCCGIAMVLTLVSVIMEAITRDSGIWVAV